MTCNCLLPHEDWCRFILPVVPTIYDLFHHRSFSIIYCHSGYSTFTANLFSPLSSIHPRIPLSLSRAVSRRATPTARWRPPFTSPSTSATARLAACAGSVGWPTANRKAPRSVSRSAPAKQAGPVISLRPTPETATAICCG